ncbi:MbnP family protein [Hymenobacter lucidus]|uniref:Copper-binding protein MbnP-like domain-containing protein n=1 Tax=Hymenobacter lucidus TaxID=2880930 RepID=A0ABS8APM2_9BACT|nr:MbnP family protein [Hymenobacter lucidus]MCB2408162.1 hypothetical protein [Hymenobacter lucidus]
MRISSLFLALAVVAVSLTGCENKNTDPDPVAQVGEMDIELDHVVGTSSLVRDAATPNYTTPSGDQFSVSVFRYYISNIKLKKADGTEYAQPESYYLIDDTKAASKRLALKNIPVGDYTGLTFTIGVDSARNMSGAQQGALAQSDMFWTWDSGYVFMKLEGRSPQANAGGFSYHIGGFKKPNIAMRTVSPALPTGVKILVRPDHTPEVHMKVDVMKLLTGPTTVRFATFATAHMPGAAAVQLANNYAAGMFSIDHIHAN